ncbi:MAG: MoxR family ATPase [Nitrospinaceae bacterium]|nr:MoxR family ATPase [Nitrospinaceae bacterium]MBT3432451.1 MoxR family ATPase [Nitrospinaceae bacterium]MBT3823117.1 MoxR family ATPase [Nitrospinaceae bacterium]MBT4093241.1 MoxR family ATPase [Nitrospinaceae bacterium]MBT4431179.1 MoxR family ATPase [Nitrospinaceae bacterium]
MYKNTEEVLTSLADQDYIASAEICTALYLAEGLKKPILVEGPAGVGKTELGKVWAASTGRELIRLQCYEGLDESKALYEWEYSKQMLYTQILRDKVQHMLTDASTLAEAADRIASEENAFFSERFLLARPILQAIRNTKPSLLLIDEIDRSDTEFEAFLLEVLSDFQVSIPEVGTIRATSPPAVLLTSNNTRELSEALKRRCLYIFVDYPSAEAELEVVRIKVPGLGDTLAQEAVDFVQELRKMGLKKSPSVSETIDWAKALLMLNAEKLDEETTKSTLTVLLKNEQDILRSRRNMKLQQQQGHGERSTEESMFDELEADLRRRSRRRRRGRGDSDDPFSGYEQLEN